MHHVEDLTGVRDSVYVLNGQESNVMVRIIVSGPEFSRIIGKGGTTIQSIRERTSCQVRGIDCSQELSEFGESMKLMVLSGLKPNVISAVDSIVELLYAQHSHAGGGDFHVSLLVDDATVSSLSLSLKYVF